MKRWHLHWRAASVVLAVATVFLVSTAIASSKPVSTSGSKAGTAEPPAQTPSAAAITAAAPQCDDELFFVTPVNTALTSSVSCTDPDGDTLTYSVISDPSDGTLALAANGSFTYTPDSGFTGTDFFEFQASDGTDVDGTFVTIKVGTNGTPVAADDAYTVKTGTPVNLSVLDNDDDPDFDSLHVAANTAPAHGSVTCHDFFCTYTSTAGYLGPDSFTYTAADDFGAQDTATVSLTVNANLPPQAFPESVNVKVNTPKEIFPAFSDPDGDDVTITGATDPPHGAATCDDFSCTYTPDTGYIGPDSFDYTVSDGTATASATISITVAANKPPVADDQTVEARQDTAKTIFPSFSDPDEDDVVKVTGATDPPHGSVTCGDFSCTYTPDAGYTGPDSFDYTVSDGELTDTGTISITVLAPCGPAVCIDNGTILLAVRPEGHLNVSDGSGSKAGPGDVGLMFLPTGNDSTSPGCLCEGWGAADAGSGVTGYANVSSDGGVNNMTLESFTSTASTAVSVVNIQNTLRVTHNYHPSPDTPNLYEVTVTIENITAGALSDIRYRRVMDWDIEPTAFSEFVTINGGNASELLFDSDNGFATANPLGARSNLGHTGNFVDQGPADHGALFDFGFGALGAGEKKTFNIFYGAAATETGANTAVAASGAEVYSFGQASTPDGPTLGTPNTFIFAFGGVGGAPIFAPDAVDDNLTTNQDTPGTVNVLANDTDPNGDPLTVTGSTNGAHGSVSCTPAGSCTYTPALGFFGSDSFTYSISDGTGGTDTATVHVTVTAVNRPPDAVADAYTTDEDTAKTVAAPGVLANDTDPDGDALSVTGHTSPAHGSLSIAADGGFTYTPAANYCGADSFTYTVGDGHGGSDSATVSLTVTCVNDPPDAVGDAYTTNQDTAKTVAAPGVLANDTDPDGDTLSVTAHTNPAHGTLTIAADGSFTYTPAAGYSGPDSFTYTIGDGHGGSDTATVDITVVAAANRPPDAVADAYTTDEDTAKTVAAPGVLANDTDPDGDALSVTGHTSPAHGTLSIAADGGFTYTPAANYCGPDSFTYTIGDGHGGTDTATVSLTVTCVNDPPDAVADAYTTDEDTAKTVAAPGVLANDTDPDGDALSVTGHTSPAHGSLSIAADGSFTYTPAANYCGPDSFGYTIGDGHGGSDSATVSLTVTCVNDPPDAVGDAYTTNQDTAKTVAAPGVLANDTDPDGDTLSVTAHTNPAHGTLTIAADGSFTYTPAAGYSGPDSFTYTIGDGHGGSDTATVDITVVAAANRPPTCDSVTATPSVLWAPNHTFELVTLRGGTDPDGDSVTITVTGVLQNEPVAAGGPDSKPGPHTNEVYLRAERSGRSSGRIYTILFTVADGHGATCHGSVTVSVSHDQGHPMKLGRATLSLGPRLALFRTAGLLPPGWFRSDRRGR